MNPYQRVQQRRESSYGLLYHNLGFYQSADEVFGSAGFVGAYNSGNMTAGDLRYQDTNGDGKIDGNDQRYLGKASKPHGQFGVNFGFQYKGFYLNLLFQGSLGSNTYLGSNATQANGQRSPLPIAFDHETNFWTPTNRDAQYPRLMSATGDNSNNNYQSSDFWLINGSYLRMKDFSFGYDFKYSVLRRAKWLSKLKVGISGQNIFTISQMTKYGFDPETGSVENYAYPLERVIAFNISIGF